jgi:hypothetical protein
MGWNKRRPRATSPQRYSNRPVASTEGPHAILAHVAERHRFDRIVEARRAKKSPAGTGQSCLGGSVHVDAAEAYLGRCASSTQFKTDTKGDIKHSRLANKCLNVDRRPLASLATLVLGLRCSWCPESAPMPRILGLHALPPAAKAAASNL